MATGRSDQVLHRSAHVNIMENDKYADISGPFATLCGEYSTLCHYLVHVIYLSVHVIFVISAFDENVRYLSSRRPGVFAFFGLFLVRYRRYKCCTEVGAASFISCFFYNRRQMVLISCFWCCVWGTIPGRTGTGALRRSPIPTTIRVCVCAVRPSSETRDCQDA